VSRAPRLGAYAKGGEDWRETTGEVQTIARKLAVVYISPQKGLPSP
jgi:hypothetical protein